MRGIAMPNASSRRFATTRWSLVLAAGNSASPDARQALAALCETYWSPVHNFVRQTGRSPEEASDLTQAFFARVLEKDGFKAARPERGRFRSFLLTSVRYFLSNQQDHDRAAKRGGAQVHVPIGPPAGDQRAAVVEPGVGETPETVFERQWALATLDAAMARLAKECKRHGRHRLFEQLKPFLTGDDAASYEASADALGIAEASVRVAVHRMRRHFGRCLRETLAETVDDPADVDQELRFLVEIVSRPRAASSLEQP
jgi:RNA polymerase sigma factor (sigma-70 family)